ncbi:MAG: tetratricopeptide repeat protein [Planctomycetes bacterium]|nr:tetratricopeptide repeat protein [Planctomycetota bacterium]
MARRKKRKVNRKLLIIVLLVPGILAVAGAVAYIVRQLPKDPLVCEERAAEKLQKAREGMAAFETLAGDPAVTEEQRKAHLTQVVNDYGSAYNELAEAIKSTEKDRREQLRYRAEAVALLEELMKVPGQTQELYDAQRKARLDQLKAIVTDDPRNVDAHTKLVEFQWILANVLGEKHPKLWSDFLVQAGPLSRLVTDDVALYHNMARAHAAQLASDPSQHAGVVTCYALALKADPRDSRTYQLWASYLMNEARARTDGDTLAPAGILSIEKVNERIAAAAEAYLADEDAPMQAQATLEKLSPRDVYRLGIDANPDSVSLRVGLAEYEYFSGNQDQAEDEFQRARAVEAKTADDLHALAVFCFRTTGTAAGDSRAQMGLELWEAARRMDPSFLDAYASPAELHLRRREYGQAVDLCRAGLKVIENGLAGRELRDIEDLQTRDLYVRGIMQMNITLARALVAELPPEAQAEARASAIAEIRTCLERAGGFFPKLDEEPYTVPTLLQLQLQLGEAKVRARLALVEGDTFTAEKLYRRIYDASPALDLEASSALVSLYLRHGQESEAARILTQLTQQYPSEPGPWLMIGQIHFAQRNMEQVDQVIRRLESLELNEEQVLVLAQLKASAQAVRVLTSSVPGGDMPEQISRVDIPQWLSYAQRLLDDEEGEEAMEVLLALKAQFPAEESVVVTLVTMYLNQNHVDLALEVLDEALKASPDSERLAFLRRVVEAPEDSRDEIYLQFIDEHEPGARRELSRARLYATRGEEGDEARYFEHMERAVELDPTMDGCLERLFTTYLRMNRLDDASRLADREAQLNLQGVEGRVYRARLLMAQQKWDEAVTLLSESLAIRERFGEVHALLGECYLSTGQVDRAADSFRASYELNHRDVRTLVGLARVAEARGDGDAHRRWVEEAYAHAPGISYVRQNWLRYRKESQEPEQFLRDCVSLYRRYPADMEVVVMLASAYEQITPPNYGKAEEIYRAVYQHNRGGEESLRYLGMLTMFLQRIGKDADAEALLGEADGAVADRAGLYLLKAQFLSQAGRPAEARAEIDRALREFPDDERGYRFLGQWALETGRDWKAGVDALAELVRRHNEDTLLVEHYFEMLIRAEMQDRAIRELQARLEARPQDDVAMALLAQVYYIQGRVDDAKAMCDRAIAANAGQVRARMLRSDILFESGQREASLADLQEAFAARRTEPIALLLAARLYQVYPDNGQMAKAILVQALGERRDSVLLLRRLAELHVRTRDWHGLDGVLARGREVQPRLAAWWILEASKWQATGQPARVAAAMRSAYQLEPGNISLALAYIDALLDVGQYANAIDTIAEVQNPAPEVAIQLQAMAGRAHVGLGNADEGTNDLSASLEAARSVQAVRMAAKHLFAALGNDQGIERLRQWIAAGRPQPSLRIALVIKLVELGRWSETGEVLAGVQEAACTPEQWVWVLRSLGETRFKQGDYAGSRQAYEAALAKAPEDVLILNNLAYMLAENLHDPASALPHARKAAELMPADPSMADTLGWIYFQNNQLDQAERELRRSLQLGETPAALYHLGRVLESLNRRDEAAVVYKRGKDLVQGNPQDPFHGLLQAKAP